MSVGLLHLHKMLAYVLVLVAVGNVVLALTGGRSNPRLAKILRVSHNFGALMIGRLNILLGLVMVFVLSYPLTTWWLWVSVLLWGPAEVAGKRMVKAELQTVLDGGAGGSRMVAGTALQLLCVVLIFGLMSVRP